MKRWMLVGLLVGLSPVMGLGDELADKGRAVVERYQDAVVSVRLVVEQGFSYEGQDSNATESKAETTGTVISESGLTVVSLTTIDPTATMEALMGMAGDGMEAMDMRFQASVNDVKLVRADGKEIAASVVLRDKDLDLAFLRPDDVAEELWHHLPLANAVTPRICDPVMILSRMGRVAGRQPALSCDRVAATVLKPRPFFVLDRQVNAVSKLGSPVFDANGQVIGLVLLRAMQSGNSFGVSQMFGSMDDMGVVPMILPAEDVLETAEQVPEAESKLADDGHDDAADAEPTTVAP